VTRIRIVIWIFDSSIAGIPALKQNTLSHQAGALERFHNEVHVLTLQMKIYAHVN
jgi:hypothetical protein